MQLVANGILLICHFAAIYVEPEWLDGSNKVVHFATRPPPPQNQELSESGRTFSLVDVPCAVVLVTSTGCSIPICADLRRLAETVSSCLQSEKLGTPFQTWNGPA